MEIAAYAEYDGKFEQVVQWFWSWACAKGTLQFSTSVELRPGNVGLCVYTQKLQRTALRIS